MPAIVEAHGITKAFGKTQAGTERRSGRTAGTVAALLGPNGVAKTTTIRILTTGLWPDRGTVVIAGWVSGTASFSRRWSCAATPCPRSH